MFANLGLFIFHSILFPSAHGILSIYHVITLPSFYNVFILADLQPSPSLAYPSSILLLHHPILPPSCASTILSLLHLALISYPSSILPLLHLASPPSYTTSKLHINYSSIGCNTQSLSQISPYQRIFSHPPSTPPSVVAGLLHH